jgi:coenzyme PQQ biosynthesis protein PqqD
MTTFAASDIPKLPRGVRLHFDAVRNTHVLLAPERAFNIDQIAATVLQLVDGKRSLKEIIDTLAVQFSADRDRIETDVTAMLDGLAAKRVLER